MNVLALSVLLVVNVAILACYFVRARRKSLWLLPLTLWLFQYFLNYVVRAFLVTLDPVGVVGANDYVMPATVYATVYAAIHVACFLWLLERGERAAPQPVAVRGFPLAGLYMLSGLLLIEFAYRAATGQFSSILIARSAQESQSAFIRIMGALAMLRWYVLGAALILLAQRSRRLRVLVPLGVSLGTGMFAAVVATSKGMLANCFLSYFIWGSVARRRLSIIVISVVVFVTGIGFYVVQLDRMQHNPEFVTGNIFDVMSRRLENLSMSRQKTKERTIQSLLGRFSYLDGLALTMSKGEALDKGDFALGSISEIPSYVPRFIAPNKRELVFEIHITEKVWGIYGPSTLMPIGRIGESYFVLGWVGLIYAPLWALLLWWLYQRLYVTTSSVFLRGVYIMLLIGTLNHDGTVMSNFVANVSAIIVAGMAHVLAGAGWREIPDAPRLAPAGAE